MIPIESIRTEQSHDPLGRPALAKTAEEFLLSHDWCKSIRRGFLANAWEGILGVFYFEIEPGTPEVDDELWVIVGDLPPAYLVVEDEPVTKDALEAYVYEMKRWVDAVMSDESVADLIPVYYQSSGKIVPPTKEFAAALKKRLEFIENSILPSCGAPGS